VKEVTKQECLSRTIIRLDPKKLPLDSGGSISSLEDEVDFNGVT
jgi:hypothetical protein